MSTDSIAISSYTDRYATSPQVPKDMDFTPLTGNLTGKLSRYVTTIQTLVWL
jgi:hypothetical protein